MEHQTSELTVVVYSICAAVIGGFFFLVWHMYSRIISTQDAFLQALTDINIEQAKHLKDIESNKEHIVRIERLVIDQSEDTANKIYTKLMALQGR